MIDLLKETELEYVKCYSECIKEEKFIRFCDNKLPDMYAYNFTLINEDATNDEIIKIIENEIKHRRKENKDFLIVETNFSIDNEVLSNLSVKSKNITKNDYMYIETNRYNELNGNEEGIIKEAKTRKDYEDAIKFDVLDGEYSIGDNFMTRRINRKIEAYKEEENNLRLYLCYYNDEPIGYCEMFINKKVAKLENFGVLANYQRKGFGTKIIRQLLKEAKCLGADIAHVITDDEDTAKEMYSKCGFKKVQEKINIRFSI